MTQLYSPKEGPNKCNDNWACPVGTDGLSRSDAIECPICLADCRVPWALRQCPNNHRFHSVCLMLWASEQLHTNGSDNLLSCPCCRYQTNEKDYHHRVSSLVLRFRTLHEQLQLLAGLISEALATISLESVTISATISAAISAERAQSLIPVIAYLESTIAMLRL